MKIDGQLADRLNGIDMQGDFALSTLFGEWGDVLNDSGFIVRENHCDQPEISPQRFVGNGGNDHEALGIDGQRCQAPTLALEETARLEHGRMLAGGESDGPWER